MSTDILLIPLEDFTDPPRKSLKLGFLKDEEVNYVSCTPQTVVLLQRFGYDVYIQTGLVESYPDDEFIRVSATVEERDSVIQTCDVVVSTSLKISEVSLFQDKAILLTRRKAITENVQFLFSQKTVHIFALDAISPCTPFSAYSMTFAIQSALGKTAALAAIDYLGIFNNTQKCQALLVPQDDIAVNACGEVLHNFGVALSSISKTPDLIITATDLKTTYKRGTVVIPLFSTLHIDAERYKVLKIEDTAALSRQTTTSVSFSVMHFLKYCHFNGFFGEGAVTEAAKFKGQNEEGIIGNKTPRQSDVLLCEQEQLVDEKMIIEDKTGEYDNKKTEVEKKPNRIVSFFMRKKTIFNSTNIVMALLFLVVVFIAVWASLENSVEVYVKGPLVVFVLSCVVGAFMARRIISAIHLPTVLLLLCISGSVSYTCLTNLQEFNTPTTSYKKYGPIVMDLVAVFLAMTVVTSSVILALRTVKLYN